MSGVSIKHIVTLSDKFRDLCKKQKYEEYILLILSRSVKLFHGVTFYKIEGQSYGECDFMDDQGNKYDTKLVFDEKQGALLGERKNNVVDWFDSMLEETSEFFRECIDNRDLSGVKNTRLYAVVRNRVLDLEEDENGILFIPYPIVNDYEGSVFFQNTTDFISSVYNKLVEDGVVGNRKIYFIYPSMEINKYCLRSGEGSREYIGVPELAEYISFSTCI